MKRAAIALLVVTLWSCRDVTLTEPERARLPSQASTLQSVAAESYRFVTKWGSEGSGELQFKSPSGIAVDEGGVVYVTDQGNRRIHRFDVDMDWLISTTWISAAVAPSGVAFDSEVGLFVANLTDGVQQYDPAVGTEVARWTFSGGLDARDIAIDGPGFLQIADSRNHRIAKFTTNGTPVSQWGEYGSDEGQIAFPQGLGLDAGEFVYVSSTAPSRVTKFTNEGEFDSVVGGEGSGDGQFISPGGIAVDSDGYVYVADAGNDRIQKFSQDGSMVTEWGSHGTGDGQFDYPVAVAVDANGRVYVVDRDNARIQVFEPARGVEPGVADLDIKPNGDPNCVKAASKGRLPVAILADRITDLTAIIVSTVAIDDDADPDTPGVLVSKSSLRKDLNADGLPDLMLKFSIPEMNSAGMLSDGAELYVTGELTNGTKILGSDFINLAGGASCN